jgi:hypothetical protein
MLPVREPGPPRWEASVNRWATARPQLTLLVNKKIIDFLAF